MFSDGLLQHEDSFIYYHLKSCFDIEWWNAFTSLLLCAGTLYTVILTPCLHTVIIFPHSHIISVPFPNNFFPLMIMVSDTPYIQVIAATNRADILDPALMRSGRLDRKIEFPHPTEEARARILQVYLLVENLYSALYLVGYVACLKWVCHTISDFPR